MDHLEQEHIDHVLGSASEFQNCASEASQRMASHNARTMASVATLVKAGSFCVVASYPWHCKATDAVVGTGYSLSSHWSTRQQAESVVQAEYRRTGGDYEMEFEVYPKAKVVATNDPQHPLQIIDDCPF